MGSKPLRLLALLDPLTPAEKVARQSGQSNLGLLGKYPSHKIEQIEFFP